MVRTRAREQRSCGCGARWRRAFRALAENRATGRFQGALFIWEAGSARLLARPGTRLPGIGTIVQIGIGILLNDRGQILFQARLDDGRLVLLRTR